MTDNSAVPLIVFSPQREPSEFINSLMRKAGEPVHCTWIPAVRDLGEALEQLNPENFEQLSAGEAAVGDAAKWMKDGIVCIITLWNGVPLVVTPPPHIDLKVVETDPGLKGDTATGGQKVAKLETGASVRVPLFINEGEVLRIDTRSGEYVSRAKG